jgi:hypothetical protein
MFSKPLRNFFVKEDANAESNNVHIVTPLQYVENPKCLDDKRSDELRQILKHYKSLMNFKSGRVYTPAEFHFLKQRFKTLYDLSQVGSRAKLLERLQHHFQQHGHALTMQRMVRGYFGRLSMMLRGPGLRKRNRCVNAQDGCTLELLENIQVHNFFSYRDRDGFIYGFEMESLMHMLTLNPMKLVNPFNRARMDKTLHYVKSLVRLECMKENESIPSYAMMTKPKYVHNDHLSRPVRRSSPSSAAAAADSHSLPLLEYNRDTTISRLREIRSQSFEERTSGLFMEIDQLGHYTQSSWFSELDAPSMLRYLRYLQDFWMYRAHMSNELKTRICPLWDPFISLMRGNVQDMTMEHIKNICLSAMEDMIFTGVDRESRVLGSFQVLTCLTLVSIPARQSMMYLYESVSY